MVFGYFRQLLHPLRRLFLALIVEPVQGGVYAAFWGGKAFPVDKYILELLFVYGLPVTYELLDRDTQGRGYALERVQLWIAEVILPLGYGLVCNPKFFTKRFLS